MIVEDDNALKYLYDYKDGKIKQGLKKKFIVSRYIRFYKQKT